MATSAAGAEDGVEAGVGGVEDATSGKISGGERRLFIYFAGRAVVCGYWVGDRGRDGVEFGRGRWRSAVEVEGSLDGETLHHVVLIITFLFNEPLT